ncbi:MAG: nucleotidyltransferase domain-containing protein [candidate division WS1 bacterium]|jgi:predicted nucleotidyltransferase|nr:nucleotidyltransferase domain-containing protein [candidate division WS1 bacterium]
MVVEHDQVEEVVREAARRLSERIRVSAVYLFGSYAGGDADKFSDIDIAVFSPDVAELGLLGRARLGTRLRLGCHRDLEPHFLPDWTLARPPRGSLAEQVIRTGKRIV